MRRQVTTNKPKAKRAVHAIRTRRPAVGVAKIAGAGAKATRSTKSAAKSRSGSKVQAATKIQPGARKSSPIKSRKGEKVVLLAGGNPQIAKGDGDAPVQAYIEAMPDWKRNVGRRLDALIVRTVPNVHKSVKWNTPFYGIEGQGWFLGFHCMTKYIKVAFFRGASLRPIPPVESKQKEVRYLHIHEGDQFNETQFTAWVKQASQMPGLRM